jgi:hypothetical protein
MSVGKDRRLLDIALAKDLIRTLVKESHDDDEDTIAVNGRPETFEIAQGGQKP